MGTTTTIIPLVDPAIGRINSATSNTVVATASGSDQAVTLSAASSALATPFKFEMASPQTVFNQSRLYGPGMIPSIVLNGTSERATIPDANYWTDALAAQSYIWCGFLTAGAAAQLAIAKSNGADATAREFEVGVNSDEKVFFTQWDETADATVTRTQDTASTLSLPHHFVVTMDNGADMTNATIYVDGALVASTASASGVFVTERDTAAVVSIGSDSAGTPAQYWASALYVGPFGPTAVQAQLTAAQAKRDYRIWRDAMGLG